MTCLIKKLTARQAVSQDVNAKQLGRMPSRV